MSRAPSTDLYLPALEALAQSGSAVYGPISFKAYLAEHKLTATSTATAISIDSYERLALSLRQKETMVFRLGVSESGGTTQFALVRIPGHLKDFFLVDDEVFTAVDGATFLPRTSMRTLYAYHLLPAYAETSLVNLALSSGLLATALGLDDPSELSAPATGQSTFTFELRFHSTVDQVVKHANGQVQMDALFVATRKGKDSVFVIEAKSDPTGKSLAKHKLVYPVLALAKHVPRDMPIVPVYLRVAKGPNGFHFHVVECSFPDPRADVRAIDELTAAKHAHFILPSFG